MAVATMDREQFIEWLRVEFPRLLQQDPRFSAEVTGVLVQALGSRAEFNRLLEEIRRLREDSERRFEAMERRFEAMDRRFEAMDRRFEAAERRFEAIERTLEEHSRTLRAHGEILARHTDMLMDHARVLRALLIGFGSLGARVGRGMEQAVRATVEEFAGLGPLKAERLVLTDAEGEVFGIRGQAIEFDCYVHDGRRFLVEVKAFAEPEDVGKFFRKLQFAQRHLTQPFEALMIAPYARRNALELARDLGIRVLTLGVEGSGRARVEKA